MWLIPSECFRSVQVPLDSMSDSVKPSIASLSLTWNGKVMRPQTWQRGFKTKPWTRLLSSLMWSVSTQVRFMDAWTRYWRDSPAHQSVSLEPVKESKTNDGSALTSGEWLARREHGCWAWRTSLDLFPAETPSEASLPTWPKAGGMRSGVVYERRTWVPAIVESGGSVWLTPQTPGGGRSVSQETVEANGMTPNGKVTVGLESQTRHWPTPHGFQAGNGPDGNEFSTEIRQWKTPRASDGEKGGPNQRGSKGDLMLPSQAAQWGTPSAHERTLDQREVDHGIQLANQASEWATPQAHDIQVGNPNRVGRYGTTAGGRNLTDDAANWPTPRERDHKGEGYEDDLPSQASRQVQTPQTGQPFSTSTRNSSRRTRLNPNFVEWLMGWPIGWTAIESTDSDSAETGSSHFKPSLYSESCVEGLRANPNHR